jgi:hypothetical protein
LISMEGPYKYYATLAILDSRKSEKLHPGDKCFAQAQAEMKHSRGISASAGKARVAGFCREIAWK